ncbi:MAG: bifunctional isocitrate dehydrogenase kinase/phosphatase [Proteobacteria bacterium]|nr:bifunctional isocitrate dehydrogenase kinase/phosphatase [Pseudomonadota bacterium]
MNERSVACCEAIRTAFGRQRRAFRNLTARGRQRFEERDWVGLRADAAERLLLYRREVDRCERQVRDLLGDDVADRSLWQDARVAYARAIEQREDGDLAETFFNSITRRIFTTVGVDRSVEFVGQQWTDPEGSDDGVLRYGPSTDVAPLVEKALHDRTWAVPYEDAAADAARAANRIDEHLAEWGLRGPRTLEVLATTFFRGKGAYLVGRLRLAVGDVPVVFALRNGPEGIFVDAVLLHEDDVSKLVSFTRWYFLADTPRPHDVVRFLTELLPRKRLSDLYLSLGHIKHGKTELYRELRIHLDATDERFEFCAGTPGLVMVCFTLPGLDSVFKVIRDRFPPEKEVTHKIVTQRYWLVHVHDRAGRLVDAQPFEQLRFDRSRFEPDLLEELLTSCSKTVTMDGDAVVVGHAYFERKVVPLNLFVRQADPEAVEAAVWDFGDALRDLAACGLFPGDVLLKNFGVTRHGRVAFYDYDELALLPGLSFKDLPPDDDDDDDWAIRPQFVPDPNDIFPAEFPRFFGLTKPLQRVLLEHHAEIFTSAWWRGVQRMIEDGKVVEFPPYSSAHRIGGRPVKRRTY